jgi:hypothetical protein
VSVLRLKDEIDVLSAYDHNYLHSIPVHPEEDAVHATDTSSVPRPDMVGSFKCQWPLGDQFKAVEKVVEIAIGLLFSESEDTIVIDTDQVLFGLIADPVFSHSGVLLLL